MHDVIVHELEAELEKYLSGEPSSAFRAHLAGCEECRTEVATLAEIARSLRSLRCDASHGASNDTNDIPVPSPGFYNRVANRIGEQSAPQWRFLSPGPAFFRRVAFASLLLLAGLGSYLVTHESEFSGADAASIMADYDSGPSPASETGGTTASPAASGAGRDHMLVTLATYREY